jgi:hypothetical protein
MILESGKHRKYFASHHELVREVFYDFGLEPDLKVNNLPYPSLGSLFKGREHFLVQMRAALGKPGHLGHKRSRPSYRLPQLPLFTASGVLEKHGRRSSLRIGMPRTTRHCFLFPRNRLEWAANHDKVMEWFDERVMK